MRSFAIGALVVAMACSPLEAAADPLDTALFDSARGVLAAARAKGFKNVGVVKFLVQRSDGPLDDDVGDLNQSLANKLEVALVLANTDEKFGVIEHASEAVRGKLPPANHRSEDGRKAFFVRKYEIGWSADKVEASGFVTGVATLSSDLTKLTIRLQMFDRMGALVDLPGEVTTPTTPELLAQAGYSYTIATAHRKAQVSGGSNAQESLQKEAVEQAAKNRDVKPAREGEPLAALTACPIKWTILYNGKPVPVTGNTAPEPQSSDRVEFTLANPTQETYGVVLLVNGESTLYQERSAPQACRKWVLGPESSITVKGFQTDANTVAPFSVLPPEQPIPDGVRYGDHAGTFRLVVFAGSMGTEAQDLIAGKPIDANLMAIARTRGGTRPAGAKPQSLKALQADLRGRLEGGATRGYVVKGNASEKYETTPVHFVISSETPIADISLRYIGQKK
jgi:hypothetical protein